MAYRINQCCKPVRYEILCGNDGHLEHVTTACQYTTGHEGYCAYVNELGVIMFADNRNEGEQ